ncbi:MAG TPA: DNA-processing protein DprA [Lachnospiraceae bacterium]|nr:DNA-processing protein DprA [Lachnospiraceae bacterium]
MKYSEIALKVLAAKECGIIKSNAQFWVNFENKVIFEERILEDNIFTKTLTRISNEFNSYESEEGIICVYDKEFPVLNYKVKNNSDKPYLLFYKGDLSLLSDLNKNVAVIGLVDPEEEIVKREADVVKRLVENDIIIVSGLALGCDTIAHKSSLELNGKTIAILPSQISKVYPAKNRKLAEEIVNKGGLLLSEYYRDSSSRSEAINRFIERDRLQAMFAKAIVLVASYRKDEGDSGSRHAMEAARKYEIERYVMYNSKTDENNKRFGLNKDLADHISINKVKILQSDSINQIKSLKDPALIENWNYVNNKQMTIFDL